MHFSNFLKRFRAKPNATTHSAFNRIYTVKEFRGLLERECARADRVGLHFALINFDLSYSKNGVASSEHLINLLSKRMRLTDELGWMDDRHIGLLLFDTRLGEACRFANSIRTAISPTIKPIDYNVYVYPADDQKARRIKRTVFAAEQLSQSLLCFLEDNVR